MNCKVLDGDELKLIVNESVSSGSPLSCCRSSSSQPGAHEIGFAIGRAGRGRQFITITQHATPAA